jgi:16S rRNA (guanine527-N7)-methyltransferase
MRKTVQISDKIKKEFPNLTISENKIELLERFLLLLSKWNKKFNLTAIRHQEDMIIKHILDAMVVFDKEELTNPSKYLSGRVLDLGSGAGIPGIILSICNPSIALVSVEKSAKKASFQEHVIRSLQVDNASVLNSRLQDIAECEEHKNAYDVIVSRALDQIKGILSYGDLFLKPLGHIILWKGKKWQDELAAVDEKLVSRYKLCCSHSYEFDGSGHGGVLLIFQKSINGE